MQAEMVEFDNKIFTLVCEKDELETKLKFAGKCQATPYKL